MSRASKSQAKSERKEAETASTSLAPDFKPGLVLDYMAGEFCADPMFVKLVLRTVDGAAFEAFVDWRIAKDFSDKLLIMAGHLKKRSMSPQDEMLSLDRDEDDTELELGDPPSPPVT